MEGFDVRVRGRDGVAVFDLRGQLDAGAESALSSARLEADGLSPDAVLLKFDEVTYINSTGIALVVQLLADARRAGRPVRASGLTDHYKHIFEITRLADFMTFYDDEESAFAHP